MGGEVARQNSVAIGRLLSLSPAQESAVRALAAGATHAQAAEIAGVARETVTRWAAHHPRFREALDLVRWSRIQEEWDMAAALRGEALRLVQAHLRQLDPSDRGAFAAALATLRELRGTPVARPAPAERYLLEDCEDADQVIDRLLRLTDDHRTMRLQNQLNRLARLSDSDDDV